MLTFSVAPGQPLAVNSSAPKGAAAPGWPAGTLLLKAMSPAATAQPGGPPLMSTEAVPAPAPPGSGRACATGANGVTALEGAEGALLPTALVAVCFGIVRLNHRLQNSPRHQAFQIGQQAITTGLLLFAGELGFGEGDLHGYGLSLDELGYFTKICAGDGVCSAPP